jgi:hypothetical protein
VVKELQSKLLEALEELKLENRCVDRMFMSSAAWEECIKNTPLRYTEPNEHVFGELRTLMSIPVIIDDISGCSLIAVDDDGYPLLVIK